MLNVWQILLGLSLCLLVVLSQTVAVYDESQYGLEPESDIDADEFIRQARGVGMRPQVFPCNGHDHLARCQHGGRGPKKTWTKAGRYCVCLCADKWRGPECAFTAETLRKRYPFFGMDRREENSI